MSNHNKETEARCPHCYRHYVEGTAAWALYMMRMGHKVTNPDDPRVYYLPEGRMIQIDGMEIIAGNLWIDYWCIDIPDGWQLYEPKPEPEQLKARIAELEAALDKAAPYLYEATGSCPSDLYDWEHPNTCIRECDRHDSPDEAWKCWRLWLMCPAPPEEK